MVNCFIMHPTRHTCCEGPSHPSLRGATNSHHSVQKWPSDGVHSSWGFVGLESTECFVSSIIFTDQTLNSSICCCQSSLLLRIGVTNVVLVNVGIVFLSRFHPRDKGSLALNCDILRHLVLTFMVQQRLYCHSWKVHGMVQKFKLYASGGLLVVKVNWKLRLPRNVLYIYAIYCEGMTYGSDFSSSSDFVCIFREYPCYGACFLGRFYRLNIFHICLLRSFRLANLSVCPPPYVSSQKYCMPWFFFGNCLNSGALLWDENPLLGIGVEFLINVFNFFYTFFYKKVSKPPWLGSYWGCCLLGRFRGGFSTFEF